ncbi:MAG: DegT/DnrJ/EryC1/StrS family aminotransferase, partial [Campylobacteraceae bacterium]|nr:DegT/DnrJ/EryC1/StrS family aminotransferase [Campylobacteraceae bacterium]
AIIPVSIYGQTSDMDKINQIAKKHGISVIEDGCQSFGASYKGGKSCNLSDIGCTSFFPSKPLGCYGDGGAVFTNDDILAKKIRTLSNHGQEERYKHKYIGINGRLDAIQAAILNVKMRYFEKEVEKREAIGSRYNELLANSGVTPPFIENNRTSVFAQYSIRCKNRDDLASKLNQGGIPTAVHYPISLHQQEAFANLGYKDGDFPISEKVSGEIMSLPMSPFLTNEQQNYIVNAIKENA